MKKRKANDSSLPQTPKTDVVRRVWISEYRRISEHLGTVLNFSRWVRQKHLAKILPISEDDNALQQKAIIDELRAQFGEKEQFVRFMEPLFSSDKNQARKAAKDLCDQAVLLAYTLDTAVTIFQDLFAPIACEKPHWPVLVPTAKPDNAEARFCLPSHPLALLHGHPLWIEQPKHPADGLQATTPNLTARALLSLIELVKTTQGCLDEFPHGLTLDRLIPPQLLKQIIVLPSFSKNSLKQYLEVCKPLLDHLCGGRFETDPSLINLGEHRKKHTASKVDGKFTSQSANIRDGIWTRIRKALWLISENSE